MFSGIFVLRFVYVFYYFIFFVFIFFFQAEDGIRDVAVTGVQTCALPIYVYNVHVWCVHVCAEYVYDMWYVVVSQKHTLSFLIGILNGFKAFLTFPFPT